MITGAACRAAVPKSAREGRTSVLGNGRNFGTGLGGSFESERVIVSTLLMSIVIEEDQRFLMTTFLSAATTLTMMNLPSSLRAFCRGRLTATSAARRVHRVPEGLGRKQGGGQKAWNEAHSWDLRR